MRDHVSDSGVTHYSVQLMRGTRPQGEPSEYFYRWLGRFYRADIRKNKRDQDGYRSPSVYSAYNNRMLVSIERIDASTPDRTKWWWKMQGSQVAVLEPRAPNIDFGKLQELRMKVLNNINDEILDVAMVIAELKGTANTLTNNLVRLGRSMDMVRRRKPESFYYLLNGRRRDGRRPTEKFLKETSSTFLEWKYGIMPTIYDIQGACRGLDTDVEGNLFDNPPLLTARAVTTWDDSYTTRPVNVGANGVAQAFSFPIRERNVLSCRVDYSVNSEILRGLNRYGLGLSTVFTIAFERTPFSFVLNMAFPIAELLKAWTSVSANVNLRSYCETHFYEHTCSPQILNFSSKESGYVGKGYSNRGLARGFSRTTRPTIPMPLPYFRNPIKLGNIQSCLALFTSLRK